MEATKKPAIGWRLRQCGHRYHDPPGLSIYPQADSGMAQLSPMDCNPCVLGSRILGGYALEGGMPIWKYISNRFLTLRKIFAWAKLSSTIPGTGLFRGEFWKHSNLAKNSDDFVFR